MNLPIRVRLTLWYAVLLAAIISCLGTFLVVQLRSDLRQAIDEEARDTSAIIVAAVDSKSRDSDDEELADAQEEVEDFLDAAAASLPPSGGAQILDGSGAVLAGYGTVAGNGPLNDQARPAGAYGLWLGEDGQAYRVRVTAFGAPDRERVLVVALSLRPVEDAVRRVLVLLLVAGPAALGATTLAAYWLARKALRPVERMTADAQEIGTGHLDERVAVPASRDELGNLALTLNAMLDRIERGVTDKQRLVADASHELRTPLAVMRAELDVSLRGDDLPPEAREVLESAREEVDRMGRTVDNLLALAQTEEGGLELLTFRLSLHQAIEDAARPLRLLALAKEVDLVVAGVDQEAQADPQRLHLALTNLIENAVKFTPSGGTVRVTAWSRDGEVGVTVTDEGPGIAAADQEHLFDRYYRTDSARSLGGSGLGLAICREVALAHGGRVWVESHPGGGSAFSLALPSWRSLPAQSPAPGAEREDLAHEPLSRSAGRP